MKRELIADIELRQKKPGSRIHGYDVVIKRSGADNYEQVETERISPDDVPRPVALSMAFKKKDKLLREAALEGVGSDVRIYEQTDEGEGPRA